MLIVSSGTRLDATYPELESSGFAFCTKAQNDDRRSYMRVVGEASKLITFYMFSCLLYEAK